jgi:hypothetical protein
VVTEKIRKVKRDGMEWKEGSRVKQKGRKKGLFNTYGTGLSEG